MIFVDVFNESTHRNEWPANQPPNFMNQFINADPGAAFPNSNISNSSSTVPIYNVQIYNGLQGDDLTLAQHCQ